MRKGVFFSLDTMFAITVAILMIIAINFFLLRVEEDPVKDLYVEKIANDILFTMVKNGTFENANNDSVAAAFSDILPENLGGVLRVELFKCSNPACTGFVKSNEYKVNKCRINVVDVVLVIDRSGSMAGQKLTDAKAAAKTFIDEMDSFSDRSGLVSFDGWNFLFWSDPDAVLEQNLTFDKAAVKAKIDALDANGGTAMGTGIQFANDHLQQKGRGSTIWAEVVLSDGLWNRGINPITAANDAKSKGIVIYGVGLGSDADNATMQQVADITGGKYFWAPDGSKLNEIYLQIAKELFTKEFEITLARTSFVTFSGAGINEFGKAELRMCLI